MTTAEESDLTFPVVNASRELYLGVPEEFLLDPISADVEASKESSDLTFPVVNASRELNLGVPEEFPLDPISADVEASKELREQEEARARARAKAEAEAKCDLGSTLMSTLLISGVVFAAIGVAFFVTKKLRE